MALKDYYNGIAGNKITEETKAPYCEVKEKLLNPHTLSVVFINKGVDDIQYIFDFFTRTAFCWCTNDYATHKKEGFTVPAIPFAQMDPELIQTMHARLEKLGGVVLDLPAYVTRPVRTVTESGLKIV